jgi:DNA repair ATPase RecN
LVVTRDRLEQQRKAVAEFEAAIDIIKNSPNGSQYRVNRSSTYGSYCKTKDETVKAERLERAEQALTHAQSTLAQMEGEWQTNQQQLAEIRAQLDILATQFNKYVVKLSELVPTIRETAKEYDRLAIPAGVQQQGVLSFFEAIALPTLSISDQRIMAKASKCDAS